MMPIYFILVSRSLSYYDKHFTLLLLSSSSLGFERGRPQRMTLEVIHEAWAQHAGGDVNVSLDVHNGGAATDITDITNACILLLPSFLQAFTALARVKYCGREESDHSSINRLLLRDVFDNITNPKVSDAPHRI